MSLDTLGWSLEQITEEIARQNVIYSDLETDALAENDPLVFQKKAFKLSCVRDRLLSLESQRAIKSSTQQCLAKLLAVFDAHKKDVSEQIHHLESRIGQLEEMAKPATAVASETLSSDISSLKEEVQNLQLCVDAVDNRTRARNVVVHGTKDKNPMQLVKELVDQKNLLKQVETAHHVGKKKPKRPLLVQFKSVAAKQEFLEVAASRKFKHRCPGVSAKNDESFLTRVGTAKIAEVAQRLQDQFPTIRVHSRFVQLGDERFTAAEFALDSSRVRQLSGGF
jgi:hypothetical protein